MSSNLYKDPAAMAGILDELRREAAKLDRGVTLMEVCGTHTHSVAGAGLRRLMPDKVRLISGPGCPVCVTPVDYLDRALALASLPETIVCTFGDLMRVPSSTVSLERARAEGASVEIVYSPRDALDLARAHPDQRVIFLAVGFETTTPTIAGALSEAEEEGVPNFLLLPGNKTMPQVMRVLVDDPELDVDGFLLPGHVSVITGWKLFEFLAEDFDVSGVVAGFMPTDVVQGVLALVRQAVEGRAEIGNVYGRVVTAEGNLRARELVDCFFEPSDETWRGFGVVPGSGLGLRSEFDHRNAALIEVAVSEPAEPVGCRCGEVLRGVIDPPECPLFDSGCDPDTPVGACMVSSEGTCAAWYRHERWAEEAGP
ncbi:MAG: hydrogenase formation protein HypD [Acidobacteria bacterium]|nr:hydrogenase formation protein HypD [Acidobacteriota bacterium]